MTFPGLQRLTVAHARYARRGGHDRTVPVVGCTCAACFAVRQAQYDPGRVDGCESGPEYRQAARAPRLVWHHMGMYELAKTVRSNLIVYPGVHGGFDLFDSATLLKHYPTKEKAKAGAERRHALLLRASNDTPPEYRQARVAR